VIAAQRAGVSEQAAVVFAGEDGESLPVGRRAGEGLGFHGKGSG
jgi:hypothetical protein